MDICAFIYLLFSSSLEDIWVFPRWAVVNVCVQAYVRVSILASLGFIPGSGTAGGGNSV